MNRLPTIFVSHAHGDYKNPMLQRLLDDLDSRLKVKYWLDNERISPGDNISNIIALGLSSSDYFLFVISKATFQSRWSKVELNSALAKQASEFDLKVISILIDNVQIPEFISEMPFIDFTQDYESGLIKLAQHLLIDIGDRVTFFEVDKDIQGKTFLDVSREINDRLIKYFLENPKEIYKLNSRLFEELIAEIFSGFGYDVELTKRTRDGGRDIIAVRHAEIKIKYLIECKHPKMGEKVGISTVRELYGVKMDERATKGILATTAFFSKDAHIFFDRHKWELEPKDFDGIMTWIGDYLRTKQLI